MKKIIISLILTIFIGISILIVWNNVIISTITLDINPSIEINLNRDEKVINVKALNNDAKDIIENLKGKTMVESINVLTNNLIEKGYIEDKQVMILLHSEGKIDNKNILNIVSKSFNEKDIFTEIIVVDNITKEDIKFAKMNNISAAKASYINSIIDDNQQIDKNNLIDKSVRELSETKTTGKYCEAGYSLEGDFCLKEIKRENASNGMVCPQGYYEYNNVCYEEIPIEEKDNYICRDEFTLNGTKCLRTNVLNAEPTKYLCEKGESKTRAEMNLTDVNSGDANDIVCVDLSTATHPVTPCELPPGDPTERMSYGGKCYWHRAPVLPEGCPGSIKVAGECWQDASNIYICEGYRDGKQYKSKNEYCEHSIKYIEPIVTEYKCPEDYVLNGNKCEKEESEDAMHERYCKEGYSLVNNDRCINYNKTTNKENGLVCNKENERLKGNQCITYEIIDAIR